MGSKTRTKPRNYALSASGVMRFSSSRTFTKGGNYKFAGKKPTAKKAPAAAKPVTVTKSIGGDKNGGKRTVRVQRLPKSFQTQTNPRKLNSTKNSFSQHQRRLKPSLTPGTVVILLAGRHKGKRVVFLKQLATGLLLVTGPFSANGCPLRRVNQIYTIGTSTKVDISGLTLPENLNDDYFKRKQLRKPRGAGAPDEQIFEAAKETYTVSDQRKADQVAVDKALIKCIKAQKEGNIILNYLRCTFCLNNHQYPHAMKF